MTGYKLTAAEKKEQVALHAWFVAEAKKIRKPLNEKQRSKWIFGRAKQICKDHKEDYSNAAKTEKGRIAYEKRAIWLACFQLGVIRDITKDMAMFVSASNLLTLTEKRSR